MQRSTRVHGLGLSVLGRTAGQSDTPHLSASPSLLTPRLPCTNPPLRVSLPLPVPHRAPARDPSTLPPLRPLPRENLSERLGLPTLDVREWCVLLGFAAPLSVGAVWAADPAGPLAAWLCGSFTRYWGLSVYKTALYLCLLLLLAACVVATVGTPRVKQGWTAALMANKVRLLATKDGNAARSAKALEQQARRLTEDECGPEPSPGVLFILVFWYGVFWLLAVLFASMFVVWALRPGYLPAQVVGAWPWQGPQPWLGAVNGGSTPVCYAPGSYPVVHHNGALPSAAGLWQAALAALGNQHGGSGAEDPVSEPGARSYKQDQPPSRLLVAGDQHAAISLSWDTVRGMWRMDWGGCLARAARVNLLAARAWRQHGLEGVRGAMVALRALQTAGGNETTGAAALEELRLVQKPGWKAAAFTVEVTGGTTRPQATSAAGEGGGVSGKRRRSKRRKVQQTEGEGAGVGSNADVDAAAATAAAAMRATEEQHAEEELSIQEQVGRGTAVRGALRDTVRSVLLVGTWHDRQLWPCACLDACTFGCAALYAPTLRSPQ